MPATADDRSSKSPARFGVKKAEAAGSGAPSVGLALPLGAEGFQVGGNGAGSGAPKMVGCRLVTVVSAGVQPVLVVFVQAHAAAELQRPPLNKGCEPGCPHGRLRAVWVGRSAKLLSGV